MRIPGASVCVGLGSVALVVFLVTLDLDKTTPGPLSPVHDREQALAGADGCARCHGEEDQTLAEACLSCHEAIAEDMLTRAGLHGAPLDVPAEACGTCHSEHHGSEVAPVNTRSFALAGVADVEAFDHSRAGYVLTGRHLGLTCAECHSEAETVVLPAGSQRYGGLDGACTTCHEDPHEGRMVLACAYCHGQEGEFSDLSAFTHIERPSLEGGHAQLACVDCHQEGYSVEAVAGLDPPAARGCADCHESPHAGAFLSAVAFLATAEGEEGCGSCHQAENWVPADLAQAEHAATGFLLEAPHEGLDCADCHAQTGPFGERHPGRRSEDCGVCHDDPHAGQFADGPFQQCLHCHAALAFSPSEFDLDKHTRTAFPLEGAHVDTDCKACHGEQMEVFRGTPGECADCHLDAHRGAFADASGCAECHGNDTFGECPDFKHGRWSGFTVDGAHAQLTCEGCHPRMDQPDEAGRTLGFAKERLEGHAGTCSACHTDPHAGVFDPALDGGCARCHGTDAFTPATGFDHAWTSFPLVGSHAQTACAECHPTLSAPTTSGRTFAMASEHFGGTACADCHTDPHLDPQGETFGSACAECHDTISFRNMKSDFKHGPETGFALAGAHAEASCSACHVARPEPDALGRIYERAAGTTCASCHSDPHGGQFRGTASVTSCERCHDDPAAWTANLLDHDETRFPLDDVHAPVACAECHQPWPLPSGGETIRYRPLGLTCAECHGFEEGDER